MVTIVVDSQQGKIFSFVAKLSAQRTETVTPSGVVAPPIPSMMEVNGLIGKLCGLIGKLCGAEY
jgi:hypothetical protein